MEPTVTLNELNAAYLELGIEERDVESWREEGYTLVVILTDGTKHRITRHAHIAAEQKACDDRRQAEQAERDGRRPANKEEVDHA